MNLFEEAERLQETADNLENKEKVRRNEEVVNIKKERKEYFRSDVSIPVSFNNDFRCKGW